MKKLLIIFFFIFTSLPLTARVGDDGWSSSGGGEYIIDQNNPWFMGSETVKWCIDHGGADKFSLPLNIARVQIEQGIAILSSQLTSINNNESSFDLLRSNPKFYDRKCGVTKEGATNWTEDCEEGLLISDKFKFVPNCNDADLEFILGNYKNNKISKLIKDIGQDKFQKIAAIAIRTEYSQENLRGKGFIYLSADKGKIQYAGERSIHIKSETIWDIVEKISKDAPFPKNVISSFTGSEISASLKLKDHAVGVLAPIVAHELGHTLGIQHNHFKNIMDEDYPANIIRTGMTFKGNLKRDSLILSRSLVESNLSRRIGFEWVRNMDQLNGEFIDYLKQENPLIHEFMYGSMSEEYNDQSNKNLFLVMDMELDSPTPEKQKIHFLTLEKNNLTYKHLKSYKLNEVALCGYPSNVGAINLRFTSIIEGIINWVFNPSTNSWTSTKEASSSTTQTVPLITLDNNYYCGEIELSDSSAIKFELRHNYYQNADELVLYDSTEEFRIINLRTSSIFGLSSEKLTPPEPVFLFENDYRAYRTK